MNGKSLVALWIGTTAGVLACLYPPMFYQDYDLHLRSGFHRFILDSSYSADFGQHWLVDSGRLTCYLLIVGFVTFAAVVTLNRRTSPAPTENTAG